MSDAVVMTKATLEMSLLMFFEKEGWASSVHFGDVLVEQSSGSVINLGELAEFIVKVTTE